jgi:hypothetical protein
MPAPIAADAHLPLIIFKRRWGVNIFSLNPARSFGSALIVGNFDYQWIYWIAPILGGLIAAGVYKGLHKNLDLPSPEAEQIKKD